MSDPRDLASHSNCNVIDEAGDPVKSCVRYYHRCLAGPPYSKSEERISKAVTPADSPAALYPWWPLLLTVSEGGTLPAI